MIPFSIFKAGRPFCLGAFLLFLAASSSAFGQHKYGLIAGSDKALVARISEPETVAIVLGCIYRIDPPPDPSGILRVLRVTVVDCYKGGLQTGQKIIITIPAAEGGPKEDDEMGRLRFFFLQRSNNHSAPHGAYNCEPVDTTPYDSGFGGEMRRMLNMVRMN